jgi:hypothetical protein
MFRTAPAPVAEPAPDVMVSADVIPLTHLALDLPEPPFGWRAYLADRHIEIVLDDLGRSAVSRGDARRLFDEHHDDEALKAEKRAAAEKRAIEADRQFRAQLGVGVPPSAIPAGMSYSAAALSAELDALDYRPRRATVAEDLLSNDGMTFHSLASTPEDES